MGSRTWFLAALLGASMLSRAGAQQPAPDPLAARVDPYVRQAARRRHDRHRQRARRPDVAWCGSCVYSNDYDIEGLVASTSTWMRNKVRPDVIRLGDRRLRAGAAEPAAPSARVSAAPTRCGGRGRRAAVVRHGGRRRRQATRRRRPDHSRRRRADRAAAVGARLGRGQHARAGAAAGPRDAHAGRARGARREAARLRDLRSGRRGTVDSARVSVAALHDMPSTPDGDQYVLRDLDGHQRRPVLSATRPAPTSRRSPTPGSTPTSGAWARSASSIRCRAAFTRATRRRSSASSTTAWRAP